MIREGLTEGGQVGCEGLHRKARPGRSRAQLQEEGLGHLLNC